MLAPPPGGIVSAAEQRLPGLQLARHARRPARRGPGRADVSSAETGSALRIRWGDRIWQRTVPWLRPAKGPRVADAHRRVHRHLCLAVVLLEDQVGRQPPAGALTLGPSDGGPG
eukprot:scaffold6021_cov117-Isochrysis_galbana.AAC.11